MRNRYIATLCLVFLTACSVVALETLVGETGVRIEVDHAAAEVLREWAFRENVSTIHVESPNLEFTFRVNGRIAAAWQGDQELSDGKTNEEYLDSRYDFKVLVLFEQKEDEVGNAIVSARSRISINTLRGLLTHLDVPTVQLTGPKPDTGVLWLDSEWSGKSQPWNTSLPGRGSDETVVIWKTKLEHYIDRKIVGHEHEPTIELVARRIR